MKKTGNILMMSMAVAALHSCGNGGIYRNDKPLCDILTGNKYDGDIKVEPYGVLVLEE